MISHFRLHDSGELLIIDHAAGTPDDPLADARQQAIERVAELLDLDVDDVDLYAVGDWLSEREL
jgi:hypothetical protein